MAENHKADLVVVGGGAAGLTAAAAASELGVEDIIVLESRIRIYIYWMESGEAFFFQSKSAFGNDASGQSRIAYKTLTQGIRANCNRAILCFKPAV